MKRFTFILLTALATTCVAGTAFADDDDKDTKSDSSDKASDKSSDKSSDATPEEKSKSVDEVTSDSGKKDGPLAAERGKIRDFMKGDAQKKLHDTQKSCFETAKKSEGDAQKTAMHACHATFVTGLRASLSSDQRDGIQSACKTIREAVHAKKAAEKSDGKTHKHPFLHICHMLFAKKGGAKTASASTSSK